MQQVDIPVLNDRLVEPIDAGTLITPSQRPKNAMTEPRPDFLAFFWNAEIMRQVLLSYEYSVVRKIEMYQDGNSRVVYVFPAYGSGEPGSKTQQTKLSIDTNSPSPEFATATSCFEVAIAFFKHRKRMQQVREQLLASLSDEQKEALRWTPPEQLTKLIQA